VADRQIIPRGTRAPERARHRLTIARAGVTIDLFGASAEHIRERRRSLVDRR
jgi:hypothetical protein